ncbi:UNVERIFIED_CONTAM: hypothetical protein Sradi_0872200 [Sesamum radiatum]|uniref:Reverse transcriptase domain-containing protein n=1 Tax=Sesamum radiatum TaxID=300843 RepID=A0AAW2V3C6_SESRA
MAKAYDRLEWGFLYKIMERMGFSDTWIHLTKSCVEGCWFSVLLNGEATASLSRPEGFVKGTHYLLFLFVSATEYFARSLDHLFRQNSKMYYSMKSKIKASHLAYADDTIFTSAWRPGLVKLMATIAKYEALSGQLVNIDKSSFIVAKSMPLLVIQCIKNVIGFMMKHLPITYLGAPLYTGNKKASLFTLLCNR